MSAERPERVLIADDDPVLRKVLSRAVQNAGFTALLATDGLEARRLLERPDAPLLILMDWAMPEHTGIELTRWIRQQEHLDLAYVALVTSNDRLDDIVEGLDAGADDFLTKPVHESELRARLRAGARVLELKRRLAARVSELAAALREVRQLRGMIPICMHCHRIRSESEHWQKLESYLEAHSDASFSHSVCEECLDLHYPANDPEAA